MADTAARPTTFGHQMSDAEALMWNIEKDPWFSSNMGTLIVLEKKPDMAQFRLRMKAAVAAIPRLRQRVVPLVGRFAPPLWRVDPDFDLDHHLRHVALPSRSTDQTVREFVSRTIEDPFDRTRPLWQFIVVDGLPKRKSGLIIKLHHTVSDGENAVRLAEHYMDFELDAAPATDVDLDAVIAADIEAEADTGDVSDLGNIDPGSLAQMVGDATTHTLRRNLGVARRAAGELALAMADPGRVPEMTEQLAGSVRATTDQLSGPDDAHRSELWATRSRRRDLQLISLPFQPHLDAARALGGSLNDLFVTAVLLGACDYHEGTDLTPDRFTATFVISTRATEGGANSFTPSQVSLPAAEMNVVDRFREVSELLTSKRSGDGSAGPGMGTVAGVANLMPTSVVTRFARSQAASIDFATSNIRSAPMPVYVGGAKALNTYPIGPVAGTAMNVTMMSYAGQLDVGCNIDPRAVDDPGRLRDRIEAGFASLLDAALTVAEDNR